MNLSRMDKINWRLYSFMSMHFVFQSFLGLLIANSISGRDKYFLGGIELINLTLAGWVFFTLFAPLYTVGIIREPNIQEEPELLREAIYVVIFVGSVRFALLSWFHILHKATYVSTDGLSNVIILAVSSIIAVIFGILYYPYFRKRRRLRSDSFQDIFERTSRTPSFITSKLERHLTDEQREELGRLLWESQRLKETSVMGLARFLWLTIILSLVFDILVELVSRIIV